jgi:hypothetical protein
MIMIAALTVLGLLISSAFRRRCPICQMTAMDGQNRCQNCGTALRTCP